MLEFLIFIFMANGEIIEIDGAFHSYQMCMEVAESIEAEIVHDSGIEGAGICFPGKISVEKNP